MPSSTSSFIINQELCIKCGQCEPDCPAHAISHDDTSKKYEINQKRCIQCSHCACLCPMAAVEDSLGHFPDCPAPKLDPEDLHVYLKGKRSIRQFHDKVIPQNILEKMVEVGEHTSTASNAQDWHATIVTTNEKKNLLIQKTKKMEALICNALKHKSIRAFAKFVPAGKTYLSDPNIEEKLRVMEEEVRSDKDTVFFNAPVVVILSTDKNSPMGAANCHLAGSAMMYELQARGIGSCYIGMTEQMLVRSSATQAQVGIPRGHKVHMVFALGYSKVKYRRLPHRKKMPVNYV